MRKRRWNEALINMKSKIDAKSLNVDIQSVINYGDINLLIERLEKRLSPKVSKEELEEALKYAMANVNDRRDKKSIK